MSRFLLALGIILAIPPLTPDARAQQAAMQSSSRPAYILYAAPGSRRLLAAESVDLKARVNRWRDLVRERGATFTIVTHPAQLARLPTGAVLVLPSAIVLDDEERRLITQRIAAGDSLLCTWMPGTLDSRGAPVPGGFIEEAFQVATTQAPPGERGFLITIGDTPLTYALPAGTRLWIGQEKRYPTPLLARLGGGYLADWTRAPAETGLLAFATVGSSRRALLGWPESAWTGHKAEFERLAQLALDWVEGKPIAFAQSWPSKYRGALTIGVDALWRFENVPRLAALLAKHDSFGSFHFLSADLAANASVVKALVAEGHSVGGFGDVARPFAGQSEREQRARVQRMSAGFRNALGPDFKVSGLRAPQGATDATTEKAAASLSYVVDFGRIDSALPVFADDRRLVLLAAGTNLGAGSTSEEIDAALANVARSTPLLGSYSYVGMDVAGFMAGSPLETHLERLLVALQAHAKPVWRATAADVAAWWRQREQLRVSSQWNASEGVMTLGLSVGENAQFAAGIALVPPPGRKPAVIDPPVAGVQLQSETDGSQTLVLTGLPQGEHRVRLHFLP